jgi:DNA-binding NtrC family response regulator
MEALHTQIGKRLSEPRREKLKKILLIDKTSNSSLSTALAREACHVIHCDRVQKAWHFVYPQRPDLIVFSLDNTDDAALADLHECRALAGSVPIIVATPLRISQELLKTLPRGTAAVVASDSAAHTATEALRNLELWSTSH